MLENLDETASIQSEKRQEWIREIRGEILQEIAEGTSSVPRLASSSAASFPGRNEWPGIHCSLVVQERRQFLPDLPKFEVKRRRRSQGGEDKASQIEEKWQTCWCCRDQQTGCRMAQASAEKLEHTEPAEKERMACHKESSWQVSQSCLRRKKKTELSVQGIRS